MIEKSPSAAHYHLPGLFEFYELYKVFLPLWRGHREYFYDWCDIGSIYGAPADCLLGGGRAAVVDADVAAADVIALMKDYDISARLTFNNSLLTEEHLADKKCNELCRKFERAGLGVAEPARAGTANGVIVHSELLADYLRREYPALYLVSSTTKVLADFADFETELRRPDFRYVVPDFRLNKAFDALGALPAGLKDKVEFLCIITNNPKGSYRIYNIPKHNGKLRTISEPYSDLKNIQEWILKNILQKIPVSIYAKAYSPNTSLKNNVRFHVKQPIVIKLDVKDFFPSIHQVSLVSLFRKFGYELNLSRMLSRLCTYDGVLPQGAPTSPYFSNLYCRRIDDRIGKYITKAGFRYTRYSDDITISGNISEKQIGTIIKFCRKCLEEEGLKLNEEKTQILKSHHRQLVTGVILNQKISA